VIVRVLTKVGAVVVSIVSIYILVCVGQVWLIGRTDQARPTQAIVVMGVAQYDGRPSPQLQARLDHVLTLWNVGLATLVVTTGGNQPGDRFTEAEASRRYLVEGGIPESAILLENEGSSTLDSLQRVGRLLEAQDITDVVIVTDAYHAARSRLVARDFGLQAHVSATPSSVVVGGENLRRHLQEGIGIALANFIGFDQLERLTD
jgi:vancomycin permeability regulator SanA